MRLLSPYFFPLKAFLAAGVVAVCTFVGGCSEMPEDKRELKIDTPGGEVISHSTEVDPSPQKITILIGEELEGVKSLSDRAYDFLETYNTDANNQELTDFDIAFAAWQLDQSSSFTKQQVVEILGSHLGNACCEHLGMEWVLVEDQYGTDYAVRSKTHEVLGFPFSSVLKRIESGENEFMNGVFYTLNHQINDGESKQRD